MTILRPPLERSRQGKFRSSGCIFLWSFFGLLLLKTRENMAQTKMNPVDLDLSRQILVCLKEVKLICVRSIIHNILHDRWCLAVSSYFSKY